MNDEVRIWLQYAEENRCVADLCLESHLYNPCLQNAQQVVEKALKALCLSAGVPFRKTHSIGKLRAELLGNGIETGLTEGDCELFDSIYLPSKYPLGTVLPDFEPDEQTARRCLELADQVIAEAKKRLGTQ